jgi:hypothetical protein
MLSSALPSSPSPDFHYFPFENSSKKLQQMVPDICVTTRRAWKSQMIREQEAAGSQAHLSPPTPVSAETSPEADEPAHFAQIAGPSKRPRILSVALEPTSCPPKSKKRATMSASSSRTQSRQRSETLDIESIYRSSRSRSTSTFPPADPLHHRQLWITEDGSPGENFVSAASVVTILSRSYKTCKNPCVTCKPHSNLYSLQISRIWTIPVTRHLKPNLILPLNSSILILMPVRRACCAVTLTTSC